MDQDLIDIDKNEIIACIKAASLFGGISEKSINEFSKDFKIKSLGKEDVLYQQGDDGDALYIVLRGKLKSSQNIGNGFHEEVEIIEQGNTAGEIASFIGGKRNTTVCALSDSMVVKIPKTIIRKLFNHSSESIQKITNLIQKRLRRQQLRAVLPSLFGNLDSAMVDQIEAHTKWVHLKSGETLYRQGEEGNSFCIVINGRLAAVVKGKDSIERKVGEITPGECVGEMSMLTGECRTADILAMRDTELILFSKEAFRQIIKLYPQIMMSITQLITNRLSNVLSSQTAEYTVTNIAIVPIHSDLSVKDFSSQLIKALSPHGSTLYLNQKRIDKFLGMKGAAQTTADNPYNINLEGWLDQQETKHRFVIYEADFYDSPWSKRCLRQSDYIFILADEEKKPSLGRHKHYLEKHNQESAVPYSLVLCHQNREKLPVNTGRWKSLLSFDNHHHIVYDCRKDFERLARFLTGQTIGLVLGGGGARGLAHIGVLRALEEAEIPVDIVCGTSIGAVISSLYAMGYSIEELTAVNKKIWIDMKPLNDYTIPLVSFMKDRKFKAMNQMLYSDIQIEDLWLNYFCISSNLTTSEMMVHRSGALGKAVRASTSIPGIAIPVIDNGSLLADGGVLNNLPGDVLKDLYGGRIIAVSVSTKEDLSFSSSEIPTPWQIIWSKISPFKDPVKCFNILDVMMRSTLLSSVNRSKDVKSKVDLYLEPPVADFGLLQFSAIDELIDIGYKYASEKIPHIIKI